jgi:hypothetical protein
MIAEISNLFALGKRMSFKKPGFIEKQNPDIEN